MDGVGADLRRILRDGPAGRTHVIGWWRGLRRFGEDTGGSAGRDDVAGIVLLNVPATDAALFLGETDLDWHPGPNRALLHDRHVSRTEVIVPFARRDSEVHVRDQHIPDQAHVQSPRDDADVPR